MSRKSELYLQDIIESCENVEQYTLGMSFGEFSADKKQLTRSSEIWKSSAKPLKIFQPIFWK